VTVTRGRVTKVAIGGSVVALGVAMAAAAIDQDRQAVGCVPASERAGRELGCYIIAHQDVGRLGPAPVFWHLDTFPSRAAAERARGARGVVVEAFERVWLLTIGDGASRTPGGTHVASIGPLPIAAGREHMAQYMEAVFTPGMKSAAHRHGGPEAWYTLSGETCLETPQGTVKGSANGRHVIVPGGPPMELTATGTETRRALVLILHDSQQPPSSYAPDWTPKGLCK
jgi:quercetin dioxygenase-like cupin family protein